MRLEPPLYELLPRGLLDPGIGCGLRDAADLHPLLDEGHVAPAVGAELRRVVVRGTGESLRIVRDVVPLLAGDLARLASDADGGVGEEADALPSLLSVGRRASRYLDHRSRHHSPSGGFAAGCLAPARARIR